MYCPRCGTQAAESASFCMQCGRALGAATAGSPSIFAGFWMRVGASLIDGLIVGGANMILFSVFGFSAIGLALGSTGRPEVAAALMARFVWLWFTLSVLVPWLYSAYFESSPRQATPGKIALRLKVTDLAGGRISFARATGRFFAEWITGFTMGIGYLMVAFTEKRQALHDKIAETVVVDVDTDPAQLAGAPAAPRMNGWAIAGIVVAAAIWPLGIIAAIAIPAYQDYTVRAQVSEGLRIASDFETAVESHYESTGHWPADASALENRNKLAKLVSSGRYVDDIEVWYGTIVITFGGEAHPRIRDYLLSLRPYANGDGGIVWQCGNADPPRGALRVRIGGDEERHEDEAVDNGDEDKPALGVTSLTDSVLPPTCRTGFRPG